MSRYHTALVVLGCVLVWAAPSAAAEVLFTGPHGRSVTQQQTLSGRYTLVVLVAPWDGTTKAVLDKLEHYRRSFRGRIHPLVIVEQSSRSVANRFMERRRQVGQWLLDEGGSLLTAYSPSVLPYTLLLSPTGEVLLRTPFLSDEVLRLLATNPGRFLRERTRRLRRGLPVTTPGTDDGPWGPPLPRDVLLESPTP